MIRVKVTVSSCLLLLAIASVAPAGPIGYIEEFSLADERPDALKQLITGTRDYYYYHCLHFQHTEQFDKADQMIAAWIKRHGHTNRVYEIQNRQALLTYDKNPAKSLEYIRRRLGIQFNHQRESLGGVANLPTALDQNLISRAALTKIALQRHSNLRGFEASAHDWLIQTDLNADRRRHLLSMLKRPDHANLPQLVVADLNHKHSRGFGSMPIHRAMLLDQLEASAKLKAGLLNNPNFVYAYLSKLRPNDDVDWRHDAVVYKAYLDRQWAFVSRLDTVHNSLKANVLYHRLLFDEMQGVYDKARFMAYLKLPRQVHYINPKYIQRPEHRHRLANLGANYQQHTLLPPIRTDESLVRRHFHHYFVKETSTKPYEPYVEVGYLRRHMAETKLVNGLGDPEQWYSWLSPSQIKALKDRIDLQFARTNQKWFNADEVVELDLHVKNVKTLLVKVFRINERNYYRDKGQEVSTAINLDGLVANHQSTQKYDVASVRRMKRHFAFPQLKAPGTYVIDFIGNGQNSRVLVRKGRLRYLVRTSTAGHVFQVMDEKNRKQAGASIILGSHTYQADEDGTITVPYTNRPVTQPVVLMAGDRVTLDSFSHQSESYHLAAGIYVDRESLLRRAKAKVVIRPSLFLNGSPVTMSILEEVKLMITSTDREGVRSTQLVKDFKLFEDRESVHEFKTPQRLHSIGFQLMAKAKVLSTGKKMDLSSQALFSINGIDRTEKTEDLHFAAVAGGYVVDLLGRTGEPKAARPIRVEIKHRDFKNTVHKTLQTDRVGRVDLGALKDVQWVRATSPQNVTHTWHPKSDDHSYHSAMHGVAGEPLSLPYMHGAAKAERSELSLLEVRGSNFVADRFAALSVANGRIAIGKLPRGDYDLLIKPMNRRIRIRLAEGQQRDGYVLSENRQLQTKDPNPLQIVSVTPNAKTVDVKLAHAGKFSRVHVFANRFDPAFSAYRHLGSVRDADPFVVSVPWEPSAYMEGRDIGDEYRYILERRFTKRYPGNLLKRPSLLLNPWAIRKTATGHQVAKPGQDAFGSASGKGTSRSAGFFGSGGNVRQKPHYSNLDFLSVGSIVLTNLVPDKDGLIQIKRELLGAHQSLHIVAVDPRQTVYRTVALPQGETEFVDLRLAKGLDANKHFTRQKRISVVPKNQAIVLPDLTTTRFERYDTVGRVYSLFTTLNAHPHLKEFGFLVGWSKLKAEQKRALYSKYACHELSFFLYKKDPEFFRQVIAPYLANKKDKTFLDRWLIAQNMGQDLSPWEYGRLNTTERILLSHRVQGERAHTSRHIQDRFDLMPPNTDRFLHLYRTALQGRALEANEDADDVELALESEAAGGRLFKQNAESLEKLADLAAAAPHANKPQASSARRERNQSKALKEMAKKTEELNDSLRDKSKMDRAEGRKVGKSRYFAADEKKRANARQFYRKLDKTQEWVENNYYHLPIEQQNAQLVGVNAFWVDYANHDPAKPFYSKHLADASNNFTEMMFALAVLDLPFEAAEHQSKLDGAKLTLTPGSDMVLFHEEIREAKVPEGKTPILVSQNFFRDGDRYKVVNGQRVDKFITDEFLIDTVYGCQVVVTNPTSSRQKLDVLLQVPAGAMPVRNGRYTRSIHLDLQPYNTTSYQYFFYFPTPGKFAHYPVHVAKDEQAVAFAEPVVLNVLAEPTKIDRQSWQYISQHGENADVVAYLKENNLGNLNLAKIAFRMKDKAFYGQITKLLSQRHRYDHTLWSYGIHHNQLPEMRQYLQHSNGFVQQCGLYIDSKPLTINPVVRHMYEHRDYAPLVNARAHQLGKQRKIVNDRFSGQYHHLMKVLSYKRDLNDADLMAVTYYMLLQDRIEEANAYFKRVNAQKLTTKLQHDYFAAYLDMYSPEPKIARAISAKYAAYPVDRWRQAFEAVSNQLDEIEGKGPRVADGEDRGQTQASLASTAPNLELKVEANQITIDYQNLQDATINYYLMDVELLFSRNPFVQKHSGQFAYIRPNQSQAIQLPKGKSTLNIALPADYHAANVLVEVVSAGQSKSAASFANTLRLQMVENYGQAVIRHAKTHKALPATYYKVYARMKNGQIRFYKDGYSDLRGRIDYTSLNTNELDNVARFSLLIASEQHGTVVREVAPPKR